MTDITDIQEIISEWISLDAEIADLRDRKGRYEAQLQEYMESQGATMIPHATHTVELKETLSYDDSKLARLRELIDPVELETSGAFIPAREEMVKVPEKWNMTKVKPFSKYGDEIKEVIEGAAYVSKLKFVVSEKPR